MGLGNEVNNSCCERAGPIRFADVLLNSKS